VISRYEENYYQDYRIARLQGILDLIDVKSPVSLGASANSPTESHLERTSYPRFAVTG
jgi:hypothetical protein